MVAAKEIEIQAYGIFYCDWRNGDLMLFSKSTTKNNSPNETVATAEAVDDSIEVDDESLLRGLSVYRYPITG